MKIIAQECAGLLGHLFMKLHIKILEAKPIEKGEGFGVLEDKWEKLSNGKTFN